jgi:hypothetical protein
VTDAGQKCAKKIRSLKTPRGKCMYTRSTAIASAILVAALTAAASAQAATITGTVNTGGTGANPNNFSGDDLTFATDPSATHSVFPLPAVTVGEFDFSVPGGQAISAGSFSGNFASNTLASATGQTTLFLDGIQLATCGAACESASQTNVVAWSYSLTAGDLVSLSSNALWQAGRAVISETQLSASQVVLDPTSVSLTATPVPVPASVWLLGSALGSLFCLGRRKLPVSRV